MAKELSSPTSFIDFFNKFRFRKYSVKLYHFHECFADLFNALPNPFLKDLQNPQYAEVYLMYVSQGLAIGESMKMVKEIPTSNLCRLVE